MPDTNTSISESDLRRIYPSPAVRKFGPNMVDSAGRRPILDVACGSGRNSIWLAHLGGRVIAIDLDIQRIEAQRVDLERTALGRVFTGIQMQKLDLLRSVWPYTPLTVGGIVNVHFFEESLLPVFSASIVSGGLLILETVEARGGNYRLLPKAGVIRAALESSFSFMVYREQTAGPEGVDAVTVKLIARKN
jgi:hypothetical protein